ncbi:hypothetical protein AB0L74_10395 [Streptomyces sp. NPDC052020]|uniref:hypothetical protein n=1 Tax=Streptomyces sp. NPDC052020 TaxID=3155677 RepID=UPI00342FB9BB
MAKVQNPLITVEMSFEELAVIRAALKGARDNYYFDTDHERDVASNLLGDLGA